MKVLIAGCGDLGTALGLELAAAGDTVFGLRRHPERLPDAIRPLAADLADPATLCDLPPVDAVVYAAAAERSTEEAYRRAYVDGVRHLLASPGIQQHPPRCFFFVSSTAVYAQDNGEWIDESSPAEATHFRGRLLLEGETLVRAATSAATATTVLRLSGIYGPGRTRLIDLVRSGRATFPPGPPRYANRIHRDDAAGALAHLLRLPQPAPLYLGVDDAPVDFAEVLTFLAVELDAPLPRLEEAPAEAGPERASKRCSNALLHASGYDFRFPTFREGYGALLRPLSRLADVARPSWETPMRPTLLSLCALLALPSSMVSGSSPGGAVGVARLEAPPESTGTILKVVASLPVRAIPVAPGEPVRKDTLLVEMDVRQLDRQIDEARARLAAEQERNRGRSSTRIPAARGVPEVNEGEMAAMSELMELQTRLSTASPRAPADGYVLQNFYAVGAQAKRRKPLVSFVAASQTQLRILLPGEAAAGFPPGSAVLVISSADPARRFRGNVLQHKTSAAGESELEIRPHDLPFLALDEPASVVVEKGP